jgi:hypothetical protein
MEKVILIELVHLTSFAARDLGTEAVVAAQQVLKGRGRKCEHNRR